MYNNGIPQLLTDANMVLMTYNNGAMQELAVSDDGLSASVMLNPDCYKGETGATEAQIGVYSGDGGLLTAIRLRINVERSFDGKGVMPDLAYPSLEAFIADKVDELANIPDWDQNNKNAKNYIENRICYEDGVKEEVLVDEADLAFTPSPSNRYLQANLEISFTFDKTECYTVIWDGKVYENLPVRETGIEHIGNLGIVLGDFFADGEEPFSIESPSGNLRISIPITDDPTHSIKITHVVPAITKIDEKYLPVLAGRRTAGEIATRRDVRLDRVLGAGNNTITKVSAPYGEVFNDVKKNSAPGYASHAEGSSTMAYGSCSHAEGASSLAYGNDGHAEGANTFAAGNYSHAEGQDSCALGVASHAENYSRADGKFSHSEGYETYSNSRCQHSQGEYNIQDTEGSKDERGRYAHIVGNGWQDNTNGKITRSNAHTLEWDGTAWYQGDIYVGSESGKNRDEGSKKLATEDFVRELLAQYKDEIISAVLDALAANPGVLTQAECYNSTEIYGDGKGYKDGYYLSDNGTDYEAVDAARVLTGFIPISMQQESGSERVPTIYVKGAEWDENSHVRLWTFAVNGDGRKVLLTGGKIAGGAMSSEDWIVTKLGDGYYRFTPTDTSALYTPEYRNFTHCRLSLTGTGENLIVSIDKEIGG